MIKPQDGTIRFIVNPKAGSSGRKKVSKQFYNFLIKNGYKINWMFTGCLEDAFDFAKSATELEDCSMIVAVGGDGLIREVADGMKGSDKPLLIIPSGNENLLGNEFGFDRSYEQLVEIFKEGNIRSFDLGQINSKAFTSIAGIGFDAEIVKRVSNNRTGHVDNLDYVQAVWRTVCDYKFTKLKVEIDGEEVFNDFGVVFVGNIAKYALNIGILKDADYSDGLLDICIYKCKGRIKFFDLSLRTLMRKHTKHKDVIYQKAKRIKISSPTKGVTSEIDGDPGPDLPLEITIVPDAVKVMVPTKPKTFGLANRIKCMFA